MNEDPDKYVSYPTMSTEELLRRVRESQNPNSYTHPTTIINLLKEVTIRYQVAIDTIRWDNGGHV